GADTFDRGVVHVEGHTEDASHGVAGDIVLGRTEAAGEHDEIGPLERSAELRRELVDIVAHDGLEAHVVADGVQPFGDRKRVRVDAKRRQQLAADGDDAGTHGYRLTAYPINRCRSASAPRSRRLAYTAAIASSAMTPMPPGSRSRRFAGKGLMTSVARKRRKPATAPIQPTGFMNSVISMPSTSSITTAPGSTVPKWRSAMLPLQEPIANMSAIAAACTAAEAGNTAHTIKPTADPNVPDAYGT